MAPIRKLQSATHFCPVEAPDRENPEVTRQYMTPCSPGQAGAQEMNWLSFEDPKSIMEGDVDMVRETSPTLLLSGLIGRLLAQHLAPPHCRAADTASLDAHLCLCPFL